MKLQEILSSVNIEKVLPIIEKWYYSDEGEEFTCKEGYVKAYNELCQMVPADTGTRYDGMEPQEIEGYEEDFIIKAPDEDFTTPWCMKLEFRRWDILIDKDIYVEEGLHITPEEMAAVCLWHITFCGFDAKTVNQKLKRWSRGHKISDRYKEDETSYWDFISEYLPNCYTRDDVLLSDILFRYLDGDDLEPEDAEMIEKEYHNDREEVRKVLLKLDKSLMAEAMDAHFETLFDK